MADENILQNEDTNEEPAPFNPEPVVDEPVVDEPVVVKPEPPKIHKHVEHAKKAKRRRHRHLGFK